MTLATALMGFFLLSGMAHAPVVSETPTPHLALVEEAGLALKEPEADKTHTVLLTAYNAVVEQTDHDPMVTATGARSNPEIVVARSRDLAEAFPYGTIIELSRTKSDTPHCRFSEVEHLIGYRVVADAMHSRKTNQIDVLFDASDTVPVYGKETNPSIALGRCGEVTIRAVGFVSIKNIPETQEELAALVQKGRGLALGN